MKLAVIAVGQAGGKITDEWLEWEATRGGNSITSVTAVNTAEADLIGLEYISEDRRVLVGQAEVKGHGVGADNELGAQVMEADIQQVQNHIDDVRVSDIDAFLVVAALGGGTGSGGAPVIAKHLQRIYEEPVYGLAILPAMDEGGIYTLNAARSFQTFIEHTDNLIMFDNDAWRQSGASVEQGYSEMNQELVKRMSVLFNAGEVDSTDQVAESVVDSSEIINTLSNGGISTIGYAVEEIERDEKGLLDRFRDTGPEIETAKAQNMITSTIRKASLGRLTLPCELDGIERALVVAAGPPNYLNRKGIERARKWIEQETGSMEVRGGDYPLDADHLAGLVLFSGVHDVPRIKELQRVAIEAKDNIEEIRQQSDAKLKDLTQDDEDELDPLF